MSRPRRKVKERDPKIVKLAMSLLSPIWGLALLSFATNGSVNLFKMTLSDRVNPTPLLLALAATILLLAIVLVVLKIQNAAGKTLAQLQAMSPDAFEDWVAARFREMGYTVKTAGAQGDHGVDLVAEKPGEYAVIQCKNYKKWSVGEPVLRDLFGAMHDFQAGHAYLVTTGRLTQPALQWAQGKPITIWDGEKVAHLSKQAARKTPNVSLASEPVTPAALPPVTAEQAAAQRTGDLHTPAVPAHPSLPAAQDGGEDRPTHHSSPITHHSTQS